MRVTTPAPPHQANSSPTGHRPTRVIEAGCDEFGGESSPELVRTGGRPRNALVSPSHTHAPDLSPTAATHGYTVVFSFAALVFAAGGILCGPLCQAVVRRSPLSNH